MKKNLITEEVCSNMKKIIEFINIAIHDYKNIDEDILQDVIENHLGELEVFAKEMLNK